MKKMTIKYYYFTFGSGHEFPNCYRKIGGKSYGRARKCMFLLHGDKWAFDYSSAEDAGVEKYNLKIVKGFTKITTHHRKFKVWCRENRVTPKKLSDNKYTLEILGLLLTNDFALDINPLQDTNILDIRFDDSGKLEYSSRLLHNTGLPWMEN